MEELFSKKIETMTKELLTAKKNNVIYGAGVIARSLLHYLRSKGVTIEAFLTDNDFYERIKHSTLQMPLKILPLNEFFESTTEKYNVIVAFRDYDEKTLTPYKDKIINIFCYDFIGALTLYDNKELNIFTPEFLNKHSEDIEKVSKILVDDNSRNELQAYIHQKTYGETKKPYYENQYFQSDLVKLKDDECFIDCGAYNGDSIREFIEFANKQNVSQTRIIAFEPDKTNAEKIKNPPPPEICILEVYQAGVGAVNSKASFVGSGTTSGSVSVSLGETNTETVNILTIDDVLKGEKATFIKLDIEGSELDALKGAKNTILKYRPSITCCIYHKPCDIFEIPLYLYELEPNYRFYVRNHSPYGVETVLYAVYEEK